MMKRILAPILLLTLLFPSIAMGETMDDLVYRDGIHYKKFSEVPFTGKTTGKIQGSFKNGKTHGPWVSYHDNGRLEYKVTFKDDKEDGPYVEYYTNGQLYFKGTYKDGKEDGPWVGYHDNGQLYFKGTYKDGKEEGPWVYYDDNGTKRFSTERYLWDEGTGTFKNGVKVK
jgi:antitoxin component YwqK of YwqJK toxin-antitoxin module